MFFQKYPDKKFILDTINQKFFMGLSKHLQIQFTDMGDDFLVATMPVNENNKRPQGTLHGGASCVLAETIGSVASGILIDLNREDLVGLEINANHLLTVRDGLIKGVARPLHIGKKTHVWDIRIYDQNQKLCCISRFTTMIIQRTLGDGD